MESQGEDPGFFDGEIREVKFGKNINITTKNIQSSSNILECESEQVKGLILIYTFVID